MANPTHRHTRTRRDKRRANWKGKMPNVNMCPECNDVKLSHTVCSNCGSYSGRKVLEIIVKEA